MSNQLIRKVRNSLTLALTLGVGMAGTALAQSVYESVYLDNNDRLGDAGIFQYYTVNGGWQTFIRVVNTSENAVSVKVRFREAANSREVLDFIIFLSPYDVWAGWTDDNATLEGNPGVRTLDTSCLYPLQDSNNTNEGWKTIAGNLLGADFQDTAYTDPYDDKGTSAELTSLMRMSEGHIEIIGIAQHDPRSAFGLAVAHDHFTGKPASCTNAASLFTDVEDLVDILTGAVGADLDNVLAMNGYVINVALGQGGGFDPDILADFVTCIEDPEIPPVIGIDDFNPCGSLVPEANVTATDPDMDSSGFRYFGAQFPSAPFAQGIKQKGVTGLTAVTGGVDAVSFEFQRAAVMNEWAASANPESVVSDYYTQWVVTFPTKHYYVDLQIDTEPLDDVSPTLFDPNPADGPGGNDAYRPFLNEFDWAGGESCEPYGMSIWNREEESYEFTSPAPIHPIDLCYETNVLVFNEFYLDQGLNSNFSVTFPHELLPVDAGGDTSERGWAAMGFHGEFSHVDNGIDPDIEDDRYIYSINAEGWLLGLPVTGWMLSVFNTNNDETNHTTINAHKYRRDFDAEEDDG